MTTLQRLFSDSLLLFEKHSIFLVVFAFFFSEEIKNNLEARFPEYRGILVITGNPEGSPCLPNLSAVTV